MSVIKYSITKDTNWSRIAWEIVYYSTLVNASSSYIDETDIEEMLHFLHIVEEKINHDILKHTEETA